LTTHYMYEADALCQRIAVIADGSFVATGTPADLKASVGDHTIVEIETFGVPAEVIDRLRKVEGVRSVGVETRDQAQVLLVQSAVGADLVRSLLNELADVETGKVVTREPTLEDAYVELVKSA
jgi:ABC-2 type transport system ATP-binding protein